MQIDILIELPSYAVDARKKFCVMLSKWHLSPKCVYHHRLPQCKIRIWELPFCGGTGYNLNLIWRIMALPQNCCRQHNNMPEVWLQCLDSPLLLRQLLQAATQVRTCEALFMETGTFMHLLSLVTHILSHLVKLSMGWAQARGTPNIAVQHATRFSGHHRELKKKSIRVWEPRVPPPIFLGAQTAMLRVRSQSLCGAGTRKKSGTSFSNGYASCSVVIDLRVPYPSAECLLGLALNRLFLLRLGH